MARARSKMWSVKTEKTGQNFVLLEFSRENKSIIKRTLPQTDKNVGKNLLYHFLIIPNCFPLLLIPIENSGERLSDQMGGSTTDLCSELFNLQFERQLFLLSEVCMSISSRLFSTNVRTTFLLPCSLSSD